MLPRLYRYVLYQYRRFACRDHYLIWVQRDGRRYGQCMECLAETEGWR